jgi:hypothetical protein
VRHSCEVDKALAEAVGVKNIDVPLNPAGKPLMVTQEEKVPNEATKTPVPIATNEDMERLRKAIDNTVAKYEAENNKYQSYGTALIFGTIIIGLLAALSGFLKKAATAGVFSLVTVASTGVNKTFPLNERAAYYQVLYAKASALQADTQLFSTMTVDQWNTRRAELLQLLESGTKLPGFGQVGPAIDELVKRDLAVSATKPASDNIPR